MSNIQVEIIIAQEEVLLLDFLQLLLPIVHHEFLDSHEAAAHSDDQLAIGNLGGDLFSPEVVLVVACAHNRNLALQAVDIFGKELVDQISHDCLIQLPRTPLQGRPSCVVLLLSFLDLARDVLKLFDQGDDLLLGLSIGFQEREDPLGELTPLSPVLEVSELLLRQVPLRAQPISGLPENVHFAKDPP